MVKRALLFLASILIVLNTSASEEEVNLPEALTYPFYYRHDASKENSVGKHKVKLLEDGLESLQKRFDIIRRAKETIEVEYFIYNLDKAGRLLTHELIEAAKKGVKVRIIVDKSIAVFKMNDYIAKELAQFGHDDKKIEIKYYNATKDVTKGQFRTHRKLITVDGEEAIIGGRNIGEEYFDMSPEFNFHDRDVYVKGPVVKAIIDTFNKFWIDKITFKPDRITPYTMPHRRDYDFNSVVEKNAYRKAKRRWHRWNKQTKKAKEFVTRTEEDLKILAKIEEKTRGTIKSLKSYSCPNLTFASDLPGARRTSLREIGRENRLEWTDEHKALRKVIDYKLKGLEKELLVDSPYLITNKIARELIAYLEDRDVGFTLYTNSLASTDAIYVAANFYSWGEYKRRKGMKVYLHEGEFFGEKDTLFEDAKLSKWGTHSKTHIYDNKEVMIGTYNIDNRSNYFNAEMALFCAGDQDFVDEVKDKIEYRMHQGIRMISKTKAIDKNGNEVSAHGKVSLFGKIVMKLISPLSIALRYLL